MRKLWLGKRARRLVAAGVSLAVAGGVTGCGIFEKHNPPTCPHVSILAEAAQMTAYRAGGGRDVTDVLFQGEVSSVDSECDYDKDAKRVDMTATLTLTAVLGAAGRGDVTLPFFVAVVDRKSQQVLNKGVFRSVIAMPEGRRQSSSVEQIEEHIPVTAGHVESDYEILVGLQLTPEQLEQNRKQRQP